MSIVLEHLAVSMRILVIDGDDDGVEITVSVNIAEQNLQSTIWNIDHLRHRKGTTTIEYKSRFKRFAIESWLRSLSTFRLEHDTLLPSRQLPIGPDSCDRE